MPTTPSDDEVLSRRKSSSSEQISQAVAVWLMDRYPGGSIRVGTDRLGVDIIKHTKEGQRLDIIDQPLPDHFRTTYRNVGTLATISRNEGAGETLYVTFAAAPHPRAEVISQPGAWAD